MKKLMLTLVVLLMAAPAMATVTVTVTDLGGGWASIDYTADVNVSAFGLNISVDDGNIIDINDYFVGECGVSNKGFGIFPASFAADINALDPNWNDAAYTPVALSGVGGALGGLNTGGITIEMGALYESGNEPNDGRLCKLQVSEDCNMTVTVNPARCGQTAGAADAGVVLEDGTAVDLTLTGATSIPIVLGWTYPACWDYVTQCHGDIDNNVTCDIADWPAFRDGFAKSHPHALYLANPCADYDRNGSIDIADWPEFRDNFADTPASDCTPGDDAHEVYKP